MCSVVSDSLQPCLTPFVACQAPLSTGSPKQEYWSGLPFPIPGGLPNPGIEPASPALARRLFIIGTTWQALLGEGCKTPTYYK